MTRYAIPIVACAAALVFVVQAPSVFAAGSSAVMVDVTQADTSGLTELEKKKAKRAARKARLAEERAKRKAKRVNSKTKNDPIFFGGS